MRSEDAVPRDDADTDDDASVLLRSSVSASLSVRRNRAKMATAISKSAAARHALPMDTRVRPRRVNAHSSGSAAEGPCE